MYMKILYFIIAIVLLVLAVAAWPWLALPVTTVNIERLDPLPAEEIDHPVAGIAQRDITPPIGIPKFGYAAWARDSDGFRTRLRVRAYYLHAPGQTPMALVTTDLGAGSLILHHRIAELIAPHTDIPAHALSLLTTHTHSGPGQFLDNDFYNLNSSNRPGFDPVLTEFLSQRIAEAIIEAREQRRPARFAVGQSSVYGLTRNRSPEAWVRNHGIDPGTIDEDMARGAVNPRLSMLRIDLQDEAGEFHPAGALTGFSIHGTAIPAFTSPWHADVWAWFGRDVEHGIHKHYETPFSVQHGTWIATHGDNSPNWEEDRRGDLEAQRIGEALASHALALFRSLDGQTQPQLDTAIGSRQRHLLTHEQNSNGLCERAIIGTAVVGAARGDEVFPIAWIPPFQHGWPRRVFTGGCHGVKRWMFSKLQLAIPADRFPHLALFQVVRINELVLVPLPWEVTLESGNRIREAVRESLPEGDWRIEIASVANGFFGYVTTPEEYSIQFYEGGHTIYGPGTLDFLARQSATLAEETLAQGGLAELPDQWRFDLIKRSYWPGTEGEPASRDVIDSPRWQPADNTRGGYWEARFRGEKPGHMRLHEPMLAMEQHDGNGWAPLMQNGIKVDDQGNSMQLKLLRERRDYAEYAVRWFPPESLAGSEKRIRFRIGGTGEVLYADIPPQQP